MLTETFFWIAGSGLMMSGVALAGGATLLLNAERFKRLVLPLVALAAGSLIGGALFHMIPGALASPTLSVNGVFGWTAAGFALFFALEQFIHYHHCHRARADCRQPMTYLILIGDGLHNFLGGMAIAGTFLADVRLGIATWLAAAAHELPQELGDFGALVHGGWTKRRALLMNLVSALMFPAGGMITYFLSFTVSTDFLIALAAGNFLYIGASDLVPEVNKSRTLSENLVHFGAFAAGLALLWAIRFWLD